MSNKPTVFNYTEHQKALKRIEELEHEVEELRKQRTNLEIKCRILEERLKSIG